MQAVIITNLEPNELEQLTTSHTSCMLPIGKDILINYLLSTFVESGVLDIIIAHTSAQSRYLSEYVKNSRSLWPKHMNIVLHEVPKNTSLPDTLHRVEHLILTDYLFITYSNTVVSSLNLRNVFLTMIRNKSSMVATFSSLPTTESKYFKSLPKELIVTSGDEDVLISYFAASDIKKQTKLPKNLLSRHRKLLCNADMRDCGFYLLSKSIVDHIIRQKEEILYKKQCIWSCIWSDLHRHSLSLDVDYNSNDDENIENHMAGLYLHHTDLNGISMYPHQDAVVSSSIMDPLMYAECHRFFAQSLKVQTSAQTKETSKEDNLIEKDCTIHPKAVIRASVLGSNCVIEAGCRILNSVLLSGVEVKENSLIQGCVFGEKVIIDQQCDLRNCAVAALQHVPSETILQSEQLGFTDAGFDVQQS